MKPGENQFHNKFNEMLKFNQILWYVEEKWKKKFSGIKQEGKLRITVRFEKCKSPISTKIVFPRRFYTSSNTSLKQFKAVESAINPSL